MNEQEGLDLPERPLGVGGEAPDALPPALAVLFVQGMSCDGCADEIECELGKLDGVVGARVLYDARAVELRVDLHRASLAQVRDQLSAMGYQADVAPPEEEAAARAHRRCACQGEDGTGCQGGRPGMQSKAASGRGAPRLGAGALVGLGASSLGKGRASPKGREAEGALAGRQVRAADEDLDFPEAQGGGVGQSGPTGMVVPASRGGEAGLGRMSLEAHMHASDAHGQAGAEHAHEGLELTGHSPVGHAHAGPLHTGQLHAGHIHSGHGHHQHGVACNHPPYQSKAAGRGRIALMLGTISGVVCLIHCMAMPILLGMVVLLPSVGSFLHGGLELILIAVTLLMAWVSVATSFRFHRRWLPMGLLLLGSGLAVVAQVEHHTASGHLNLVGLSGTVLLVASIWVNRVFLRRSVYPIHVEPLPSDG